MAGVGGQGVILASDSLAEVAMRAGFDVKKSDALGMAQRGGSVVSHIRIGPKVFAPLIKKGEADFLLGFERLEAARCANNLRPDGLAIINDQELPPLSVVGGAVDYPDQSGRPSQGPGTLAGATGMSQESALFLPMPRLVLASCRMRSRETAGCPGGMTFSMAW